MPDHELYRALRRALKPYAQDAPLPDDTNAIPDDWVRPVGRISRVAQLLAPVAVAIVAAGTTWAALALLDGPANAPLVPGGGVAPAASTMPVDTTEFASPPAPDAPPAVTVGGVAGEPVTWCYGNACVDGVYVGPAEDLPAAQTLGPVEASTGFETMRARVFATDDSSADVPVNGMDLGPLPAGQWERLEITVTFGGGSDATYMWRLALDS